MVVSGTTGRALRIFQQLERAKRRVQELKIELEPYVKKIPEDEISLYADQTERIKKLESNRLEKFKRRRALKVKTRGYS